MTIRENILSTLSSDLLNIQVANGYENSVKVVKKGVYQESQVTETPFICYYISGDEHKGFHSENMDFEVRMLSINMIVYLNSGTANIIDVVETMNNDLNKHFKYDSSIVSDYHSHIENIDGVYVDETRKLTLDKINMWYGDNKADMLVTIIVFYLQQYNANVNSDSTTPEYPSVLDAYTLTSSFISSTANLQTQINNIAASGANEWGTIYGDITEQEDLIQKFNEYATSGSLTGIDFSPYSLTSHNHALSGLSEKSYNSLNDLPNLDTYTTTANFIATTGTLTGATLLHRYSPSGWTYFTNTTDRVGIGYTPNTALGYELDVSGKIRATNNIYTNNGLFADVNISSPVFKPRYNTPFVFANYYNIALGTVLSGGQWGIGTQTPNEKFSISGNLSVTGLIYTNGLSGCSGTITANQTFTVTNGIITSIGA